MPHDQTAPPHVLHVCTSCRPAGSAREPWEHRPGFKLYAAVRAAVADSPLHGLVDVRPAECLSICPRPCGARCPLRDGGPTLR